MSTRSRSRSGARSAAAPRDRRARLTVAFAAVVVAVGVIAGCGGDGGGAKAGRPEPETPSAPASLDGLKFESTRVSGRTLVEGTAVVLAFDDGRLTVGAGCNTMSGPYRIEGGRLRLESGLASTAMGCDEELMEQDGWVAELLTDGPSVSRSGPTLTVSGGSVVITLEEPGSGVEVPLVGTVWALESIVEGDTVSSVPAGVETPTIGIDDQGEVALFAGCNRGGAHVELDGGRATFGPFRLTKKACGSPASEVEAAVVAVLHGGVDLALDGDRLSVTATGAGDASRGLVFRARGGSTDTPPGTGPGASDAGAGAGSGTGE